MTDTDYRRDPPPVGGLELPAAPAEPVPDAAASNRQQAKEDRRALTEVLRPVSGWLIAGRVLAALSGVFAITPYVGLSLLGTVLLDAHRAGHAPPADAVWSVLKLVTAGFALRILCYGVGLGLTHWADVQLGNRMRRDILSVVARAPLAWFSSSSSGRLRKAVQGDTRDIHYLIAHKPVEVTAAAVGPLAALVYAFVIDWRLGLLTIATLPVYVLIFLAGMRGIAEKTVGMDARQAEVSATVVEFVAGIGVVKAFGRTGRAHSRYAAAAKASADYFVDWCGPMLRSSALSTMFISPPVILVVNLAGGALMIRAGWVNPVQVLTTTLIALMLPAAIEILGGSRWSQQQAAAAARRLVHLFRTDTLPVRAEPATAATVVPAPPDPTADTGIRFDDVTFAYGETVALRDVTLDLPTGSLTAVVGPSGSGKSTLATLIARFHDPASGAVRIGGVDLRDLPPDELYRTVSFVLQDAQLLRLPLVDNIRLARPDATLDEVRAAARRAQIDEVITALPRGYDTVLGDETMLSGGQEQRVAIARALLADTPVLILDEATAFADPESEAAIQDALSELIAGRTVVVIAHRLGSVVDADRIVVLDRGAVAATGTHAELLDTPLYARMWASFQAGEELQK